MNTMTTIISFFLFATIIQVTMSVMTIQYINVMPELYGDYDPSNMGEEIPESDFDELCKEAITLAKRGLKEGAREFGGFSVELNTDDKEVKMNAIECPSIPSNIFVCKVSNDGDGTYFAYVVRILESTYLKGFKKSSSGSSESKTTEGQSSKEIPKVPKF